MTASAVRAGRRAASGSEAEPPAADKPLAVIGALAACVAAAVGLATVTLLVLVGWIAAPTAGIGLPAVLRTAAVLWLAAQHVDFTLRGVGRIGMLPLGLVLLPGALLWRAGRWVVRTGQVRRLRHVAVAATALAAPYSVLTGALAAASRSALGASSVPEAVACGLLVAFVAGGLGGARALAPWSVLVRLLPARSRSLVVAIAGTLATLALAGALLAALALGARLHSAATMQHSLAPGVVGSLLLLLLQLAYLPNAIIWAVAFSLGPGFAFGSATIVAPTGSALGRLPALPLLAELPPGPHTAMPGWLAAAVLAVPYLAGVIGGLLFVRAGAVLSLDAAPLWALAGGAICGAALSLLAAVSGGPLGDGRLAAVGPSAWQAGLVSALELGISAAVTAGAANYLLLRRAAAAGEEAGANASTCGPTTGRSADGHIIYLDPWAGEQTRPPQGQPGGPSKLPHNRNVTPS